MKINRKMDKIVEQACHKRKIQMVNIYVKQCLILLVIRKM